MARGRIIVVAVTGIFCLIALFTAAIFIGMRNFNSGLKADFRSLELEIKKAAVDSLILIKQPRNSTISPNEYSSGSLHDSRTLNTDEKVFDTWQVAAQLGEQTLKRTTGEWAKSSADADYVPSSQRADAWGHSFCLLRRANTVVVVSAGSKALASPVCRDVRIRAEELAPLPRARLLESPSGYLILVLDKRS